MHYSDDELATFRRDHAQAAHQATMERHLAECAECRETLALFDSLEGSLRKAEVWGKVPEFLAPAPGLEDLLAEKATIEEENSDAAERLEPCLKSPLHFEDANVAEDRRFHHAGVVRMLVTETTALCERQPKFALQLATAAVTIARTLQSPLLGVALRERANALRYLGRFKDALAAADEAEAIFRRTRADAFDLSILSYVRSTVVIQFEERSAEALELARAAIATFREYGDKKRELSARLVEAEALKVVSGAATAASAYEEVLTLAHRLRRADLVAHASHNAATAYVELGELDRAEAYYVDALAGYDEQGNAVGKANTEWELARILVLRGQLEDGAAALEVARKKLLELGLRDDHGLATLDWAETRMALDKPEGVADACREIMPRYDSEGATRNARLALALLQEALRKGVATPRLVHQVRDYLAQLPDNPTAEFRPAA